MGWVWLDDHFPDHPKVVAAGPVAGWLHVCGLCYCNRFLTDGFIPRSVAHRLTDFEHVGLTTGGVRGMVEVGDDADCEWMAAVLCQQGLWVEVEGGYVIHDYLEYQRSREQAEELREQRSKAGKKGGLASGRTRSKQTKQTSKQVLEQTGSKREAKTNPTPTPTEDLGLGSEEPRLVKLNGSEAALVREVFEHWQVKLKHPKAKLTADRKTKIRARLREGFTVEQLKQAIDGVLIDADRWPDRLLHDGPETIFKGGGQVEKFIGLASNSKRVPTSAAEKNALDDERRRQREALAAKA